LVANTAQVKEFTKVAAALHEAVLAAHREWRLHLKGQRGECTCPRNQNPYLCPSLKEFHIISNEDLHTLYQLHRDKEPT
jgi:hypothetical protein